MKKLADHSVVVTGAARGIGRAIAALCAREGARVTLVDRMAPELSAAVETMKSDGCDVEARVCELTDAGAVADLFDAVMKKHGRIDGLVNNAGTTIYGSALETSLDDLMHVLRVHLAPTLLCAQAAAKVMMPAGRGRIVNMSSAAAEAAVTRLFGYSMAKAAIVSMTQHLAAELGEKGIAVNALAPGPVLTEALRGNQNPAVQQMLRSGIPMDRFAEPEEVAAAAVFLLSDAAGYINGHVLTIDGGLMAMRTPLHRLSGRS